MNFKTEFISEAEPQAVFAALHQYKVSQNPARFFPSRLVRWHFEVLTSHTLGQGATYEWKIWLLGFPVLAFTEQVVAWQDGRLVVYEAISGWDMRFRVDLAPDEGGTLVKVAIDFSLGVRFLDWLLRPFIEWGLGRVVRSGLGKEGIRTRAIRRWQAGLDAD